MGNNLKIFNWANVIYFVFLCLFCIKTPIYIVPFLIYVATCYILIRFVSPLLKTDSFPFIVYILGFLPLMIFNDFYYNFPLWFSSISIPLIMLAVKDTGVNPNTLLMNYIIANDFDTQYANYLYRIPTLTANKNHRMINNELSILEAVNNEIQHSNKLSNKNIQDIGMLPFAIPKSSLILVYLTIINYCVTPTKNPILLKVRDYSNQKFDLSRGDYMVEFYIDNNALGMVNGETIIEAINKIAITCDNKKMDIYGIDTGVQSSNNSMFIVRIKFKKNKFSNEKIIQEQNGAATIPQTVFSVGTNYEKTR